MSRLSEIITFFVPQINSVSVENHQLKVFSRFIEIVCMSAITFYDHEL